MTPLERMTLVAALKAKAYADGNPNGGTVPTARTLLDGVLNEGDPLPSVRTVAAEFRVNPLTVLKAYQQLVDEDLVEMKRGLGMFVKPGARDQLLKGERQKFLTDEWPRIAEKIERLGLTQKELDVAAAGSSSSRKR